MPRVDKDQRIAPDGSVISETIVERPERVVAEPDYRQAKQTLRTMWTTFMDQGQPTGTPTAVQLRNWNLALTAAVRYLAGELDDEV
jgi:hypothetical protein